MMKLVYVIAVLIGLLSTSCKTSNMFHKSNTSNKVSDIDPVFKPSYNYQYHIRKDDKITISVWGQDDLSIGSSYGIYNSNEVYGKWLMVDAEGKIEIPKLGSLKVENKTIIELKSILKERFGLWVKNPIVDIKILNREITILGEVRDPQVIVVDKEKNPLLDMIARCKGFEFYANINYIKVLRQVGNDVHIANINLSKDGDIRLKNIELYPGDVVIVPSKKYKVFDKRISTIIPFTSTMTAAAILMGAF